MNSAVKLGNLKSVVRNAIRVFALFALSLAAIAQQKPAEPARKPVESTTVDPVNQQKDRATVSPVDLSAPVNRPNTDPSSGASIPQASLASRADIKIGVGDLIAIKVYGVTELSDEVRVNGAGDISLPLIGNFHMEGLTSEQAERALEKKLVDGGFLRDPHVSIFVKEYVTAGISMMGEVSKPGIYPMIGARRLFDAISIAGGLTARAGNTITITHKDHPETPVTVKFEQELMTSGAANVEIMPGDIIMISKAGIIYVTGDVTKPGGFVIENNEKISVLKALAMAGGQNKTASLGKARIYRTNVDGLRTDKPIPLDKIMNGKEKDIELMPEDILFVPNNAAKEFGNKAMQNIMSTISSLLIFRP